MSQNETQEETQDINENTNENDPITIEPLPESYLEDVFSILIRNDLQANNETLTDEEFQNLLEKNITDNLQNLEDDILSFDIMRFNQGYDNFTALIGLDEIIPKIDNDQISTAIKTRTQNVPELAELYSLIELYQNYSILTDHSNSSSLNTKTIGDFADKIDNLDLNLSENNLANLYYHTAQLYNLYLNTLSNGAYVDEFTKQSKDEYLIKALSLTDNPKTIESCYNSLPHSHIKNELTQEACQRALAYMDEQTPKHDFYITYKTLGDTYHRVPKAGFQISHMREKLKAKNTQACQYYNTALQYCQNPAERALLQYKIKKTDIQFYNQHITPSKQSSSDDCSIKSAPYAKLKSAKEH